MSTLRSSRARCTVAALTFLTLTFPLSGGTSFASALAGRAVRAPSNTLPVLRWSVNQYGDQWVHTLDPATAGDTLSLSDIAMVQANLVKLSYPSLQVIPDLATWTVSPNGKTYTFHLRNARFSNGDYVTAQDAAWSITRALLPATKSPVAMTYLGHIVGAAAVSNGKAKSLSGLRVVNSRTLQITLDAPISFFLQALTYPTSDVLDKRVLAGKPAQAYMTNSCRANVGAGPFKFACLSGSDKASFYPSGHSPYMKFVPNPFYYGSRPKIAVYAPLFTSDDVMYKAWRAGELDATDVPSADIAPAQKTPGFVKTPQLQTDYLVPNTRMAPFNNVHCRLAVAYAIDRENITRKLMRGGAGPLYDVVPPHMIGYFGKESDVPHFDAARARKELGLCPGKLQNVTLSYQSTGSDVDHEYDAIRANLASIGVNITLKPLSFNAWANIVSQPLSATHTQIAESTWSADYPDTQDWVDNLLHSGSSYNIGGFNNSRYDKLVEAANVTRNPARRASLYRQAQKIVVKAGNWIGVGYPIVPYIVNPNVHGMVATPEGIWPEGNDWSKVSISE